MDQVSPGKTSFSRVALLSLILVMGGTETRAQYEVTLADPVEVRTLSGHVQDPAKAQIEGATVEVLDAQTDTVITSAETDSKGNFHFKDFGKNTYKLKITKPGFKVLHVTLRIRKHSPELAVVTLPIAA
ncbi:MAG TPA: carboxypeptidase-like regulatory domain-containing protein [Edaphobacter sp.]|jgi:hypothetical protein|nr:carboxypeptidase-like regulatory domain-containing protein [Edaphobacter sp.]